MKKLICKWLYFLPINHSLDNQLTWNKFTLNLLTVLNNYLTGIIASISHEALRFDFLLHEFMYYRIINLVGSYKIPKNNNYKQKWKINYFNYLHRISNDFCLPEVLKVWRRFKVSFVLCQIIPKIKKPTFDLWFQSGTKYLHIFSLRRSSISMTSECKEINVINTVIPCC